MYKTYIYCILTIIITIVVIIIGKLLFVKNNKIETFIDNLNLPNIQNTLHKIIPDANTDMLKNLGTRIKDQLLNLNQSPKGKTQQPKCNFMTSHSESFTCPEKMPNHLGAVFGAKSSSGINCNGKKMKVNRAKAYAILKDKKIHAIKITNGGNNYVNPPKIYIKSKGNGKGAKARAKLDKNTTSVKKITILNSGDSYDNTPNIVIGSPNGHTYCHLCCKLPN